MKKIFVISALLFAFNSLANEVASNESDLKFIANALENEGENVKVQIKSQCEIETYSQQRFGQMRITNQANYYLGNIRSLSVKNTENVGKAGVSERTMAKTYPYSLEFDGTPQSIVVQSLHIAENLQFPQYNKPAESNKWTRFYIMFNNRTEAEVGLKKLKNLAERCI